MSVCWNIKDSANFCAIFLFSFWLQGWSLQLHEKYWACRQLLEELDPLCLLRNNLSFSSCLDLQFCWRKIWDQIEYLIGKFAVVKPVTAGSIRSSIFCFVLCSAFSWLVSEWSVVQDSLLLLPDTSRKPVVAIFGE